MEQDSKPEGTIKTKQPLKVTRAFIVVALFALLIFLGWALVVGVEFCFLGCSTFYGKDAIIIMLIYLFAIPVIPVVAIWIFIVSRIEKKRLSMGEADKAKQRLYSVAFARSSVYALVILCLVAIVVIGTLVHWDVFVILCLVAIVVIGRLMHREIGNFRRDGN
ncbi:hypothetical protein FWF93_02645 [Candidatus Saccharibacteria bacterium]|nr:hypothetical protein [Candidatus Saccharibacteria bacterium]